MIPHFAEMALARAQFLDLAVPTLSGNRFLQQQPIDLVHACNVAGPIIEMDVDLLPGDIFSFCENRDGVLAFVQLVFDDDAETPIDFIAWTRDQPRRVYRYFGFADTLGVDQLHNPASYFGGQGLSIRRSPLDWLHARCAGAVILVDANQFRQRLARVDIPACRLVGDTIAHAQQLRKALGPLPGNVSICVPASLQEAA